MKPARLMLGVCALFFILMAGATVFSVGRDYARLPKTELVLARPEGDNTYTVPLAAVREDGEGRTFLLFVREKEGPWGKEYVCRRAFLNLLRQDPEGGSALVAGQDLCRYPIAGASEESLADGQRVRFATEVRP